MKGWVLAAALLAAFAAAPAPAEAYAVVCNDVACVVLDQLPECQRGLQVAHAACRLLDYQAVVSDPVGTLVGCLP